MEARFDYKNAIRDFIQHRTGASEIGDDCDLFANGYVTSLLALQLVMFLESEFDISVDDSDLDRRNFATVYAIDSLVERKRGLRQDQEAV